MPWIEVSLNVAPESVESVGQALIERGSLGIWERDPGTLTAYFPAGINRNQLQEMLQEVTPGLAADALSVVEVPEQDWVARWKAGLTPLRITPRLVIVPSWQTYRAEPGEHVVVLDPGMAFGTGHHESTRMCLELLDDRLRRGRIFNMLDLGTGSGILAIAAARLGAGRVVASDIDPVARETAARNVEINGLAGLATVVGAEGGWKLGPYDLIVANLTAEDLSALMPLIAEHLAPEGTAILSGILASRELIVARALTASDLRVTRRRVDGEWAALEVARNENPLPL
jgi:ribosomal protein L11 methyltransferase